MGEGWRGAVGDDVKTSTAAAPAPARTFANAMAAAAAAAPASVDASAVVAAENKLPIIPSRIVSVIGRGSG